MLKKLRFSISLLFYCLIILIVPSCTREQKREEIEFLLDWKAGMEYVGFFVAKEKGYYQEENLDVKIQDGSGAGVSAKLIADRKYQIGLCTGDATVIGIEQGFPIKSLAVLFQKSPVVIYSLKELNIKEPKDLVGKTLGVSTGDTKYNYYQGLMNRLGTQRKKIKEVTVGFEVAPLLTRQVDALLGYINVQPVQVELQGKEVNIIKMSDYGLDIYSEGIIANTEFLKEKPDTVRRFIRASLKGWQYAVDNPKETVEIFAKTHPEYDAKFLTESFQRVIPLLKSPDTEKGGLGAQTAASWQRTRDILLEFGLIKSKVEIDKIFTNEFLLNK